MLKCFEEGKDESDIIQLFQGDEQLVEIWKNFIIHNHWMNERDGKWEATPKGLEWTRKYDLLIASPKYAWNSR